MDQMSFDDLINEKENKYHKNRWYALCEYKGKGKNKKPYQIQASQSKEKLLDRKDSLEFEYPDKEYDVRTTLEFDKMRK